MFDKKKKNDAQIDIQNINGDNHDEFNGIDR